MTCQFARFKRVSISEVLPVHSVLEMHQRFLEGSLGDTGEMAEVAGRITSETFREIRFGTHG